ncbi:RTF domain-containing protein [Coprinopsis sp. MPI-PUGE-AT-0042]|nr:RTF domain-containing protein [Coprinopsis sp. MPI-PUGE-AT-0042]
MADHAPEKEDKPSPSQSLVNSSFSSLSFLVALQLFSRLFTSLLNQALFRLASPSVFGTAAIQFELILSTILFLSREGVRNAILRNGEIPSGASPRERDIIRLKTRNLTFVPLWLGLPLAVMTSFGYVTLASEEVRKQPRLVTAVAMYAIAAVIELASEPMHNMAMTQLKTDVRVRAEGLGITFKSLTTFLILVYDTRLGTGSLPLIAFAAGQVVYSVVVFSYYSRTLGAPWVSESSLRTSKFNVDRKLFRLSMTMTGQSVIKHILTEGDKMVLSFFSPLEDQGGYAIALNYGSLIARIVFQPIEETLRVFFSKLLTPSKRSTIRKESLTQSSSALIGLLATQIAFSIILMIFGSAYLPVVLPVVLPPPYLATGAPRILAAWIFYIPVLALNGGLEAFLSSAASPKDLNKQSRWMVAFSAIYIAVTILLYRAGFGDVSLIYANIINLSARIFYCLSFAVSFFALQPQPQASPPWTTMLPSPFFVVASLVSLFLVQFSKERFGVEAIVRSQGRGLIFAPAVLIHIAVGGVLALSCLGIWWIQQGRHIVAKFKVSKVD